MVGVIEIDRAIRAHFTIVKDSEKPLQVDKNYDDAVGMAVTVFVGLAEHYGVPPKDVELHLAITREERENKYKRLKAHLIDGKVLDDMLRRGKDELTLQEKDDIRASSHWRHYVRFNLCKNYIRSHFTSRREWVTNKSIFG